MLKLSFPSLCAPFATLTPDLQGLAAAGLDGVMLGGNYVCGVALGKCVEHGYDFANQISSYVTSNAKVAA
jgi:oxygen-dependent protoporphyrinogen oxidase